MCALYRDCFQVQSLLVLERVTPEGAFPQRAGEPGETPLVPRLGKAAPSRASHCWGNRPGLQLREIHVSPPGDTPGEKGAAQGSPAWLVFEEPFPLDRDRSGHRSRVRTRCEGQAIAVGFYNSISARKKSLFPCDLDTQACVTSREKAEVQPGPCTPGVGLRGAGSREGGGDVPGSRRGPGGGGRNVLLRFHSHRREKPTVSPHKPPPSSGGSGRPLRAGPGLVPVAAAGAAAGWLGGGTARCRVQNPGSSPLHPGGGRVNTSVQGMGSLHWGGGRREGDLSNRSLPAPWQTLLLETASSLFYHWAGLCGHFRAASSFCTGPRSEGDLFIIPLLAGERGEKKYSC